MNKKPRVFVLGDTHGAYLALIQVLERCGFDYANDWLITIGDIVDGWQDSFRVVEELLKIENRIDIMGNHDAFLRTFIDTGIHDEYWALGGLSTAKSYAKAAGVELMIHQKGVNFNGDPTYTLNLNSGDIPEDHQRFFRGQHKYYKDSDNNLFVHGGFNPHSPLKGQLPYSLMWDRWLWTEHLGIKKGIRKKMKYVEEFRNIFVGHTATYGKPLLTDEPVHIHKLWNVDTGAGGGGKLTIMNVDTHEYWQSDNVPSLYPDDEHNLKNE